MKIFHCTKCQNLVFFENIRCLNCAHPLAYLSDQRVMAALEAGDDGLWRSAETGNGNQAYRLCANYDQANVCNWAVPADDADPLCGSCRLTRVIPDLAKPGNKEAWYRLEVAKRRLVYGLHTLGLPTAKKADDEAAGLAFEFLEDSDGADADPVLTGHDNGVIVINVGEADDVRREQQRTQNHEPYRTLLGHFRHESGHYYWDRLIQGTPRLGAFRETFGDERADYQEALQRHYANGPTPDWEQAFISAYATTHPWEDWAESWAHFLHMSDALETAGAIGLQVKPRRPDEPSMAGSADVATAGKDSFDRMIRDWLPLTYVLNSLSRGLGLPDSYPFVLSLPVIKKLRFVHDTIADSHV